MRLAVLAERVTDTVAVLSSSVCYCLLHITDSSHACQSNTTTRYGCRGYPAHQMLSSTSAVSGERERE